MKYDFAPKLAHVITDYSTAIKEGDFVVILGNTEAVPLIEALYEAVLRRGGNPVVQLNIPGLREMRLELAGDRQLDFMNPIQKLVVEEADVILAIEAPSNTKSLASSDPARITRWQQAIAPLMPVQLRRMGDGSLRWCLMAWPTAAAAQQTDMGLHAYTQFLFRAYALDQDDPVAHWCGVKALHERLLAFLGGKSHVEVKGPDVELTFDYGGREWVSAHGEVNFPDGEIFTGPVESSVNGYVRFNMPTIHQGREVNGVCLTFKDGKVVEASASKGEDYLLSQLELDEGARWLGEFAIGTNRGVDRVTGSTLLDEKIGGSFHMALGASLPQTKGVNESQLHWDMVHDLKDGGEIYVDGQLFNRGGEFTVV
ncbi:MAG TPA: aminopeptidase [Candidatus Sulfomarinibacteraceae bacterium]|nr:aminopeptidase [Candidatus Sulfomarinibacteraceae bacterium]